MPRKYQKIDRTNISERLIHSYPDSIVTTSDGDLDFENTLYNFSTNIIENLSERRMQIFFNRIFDNVDDVYDYLINNVSELRESLENQINNTEDEG